MIGTGPGKIRIEAATREQAEALSVSDAEFTRRFGVPVEAGWDGFPEALPIIIAAAHQGGPGPWGPHLFFSRPDLDPPAAAIRRIGALACRP